MTDEQKQSEAEYRRNHPVPQNETDAERVAREAREQAERAQSNPPQTNPAQPNPQTNRY